LEVYVAVWQRIGKDTEGVGCGALLAWSYCDEQRKARYMCRPIFEPVVQEQKTRSNTA
jgi:hypothetical protein